MVKTPDHKKKCFLCLSRCRISVLRGLFYSILRRDVCKCSFPSQGARTENSCIWISDRSEICCLVNHWRQTLQLAVIQNRDSLFPNKIRFWFHSPYIQEMWVLAYLNYCLGNIESFKTCYLSFPSIWHFYGYLLL